MRKKNLVAAVGDPTDLSTFGGTPYYFLKEGMRQNFFDGGLALNSETSSIKLARLLWSIRTLLFRREYGGFQYTNQFLELLWRNADVIGGGVIFNLFQLFPESIVRNEKIEKWFYIDQTLNQLFENYGRPGNIGYESSACIIDRERHGYDSAKGIFVVSEDAKEDLTKTYGINPNKVCVVPRGANVDHESYRLLSSSKTPSNCISEKPLRLVFVGRDAYRKGLDRLIRAFILAEKWGANIELLVVGTEELKEEVKSDNVIWCGRIDKKVDLEKFLSLLSKSDIGCLLSRAEAGGISLREFHAAGLPVMFPNVGGSKCFVLPDASFPVSPADTDEKIANLILWLDRNRELVMKAKNVAWDRRLEMLWPYALDKVKSFVSLMS